MPKRLRGEKQLQVATMIRPEVREQANKFSELHMINKVDMFSAIIANWMLLPKDQRELALMLGQKATKLHEAGIPFQADSGFEGINLKDFIGGKQEASTDNHLGDKSL